MPLKRQTRNKIYKWYEKNPPADMVIQVIIGALFGYLLPIILDNVFNGNIISFSTFMSVVIISLGIIYLWFFSKTAVRPKNKKSSTDRVEKTLTDKLNEAAKNGNSEQWHKIIEMLKEYSEVTTNIEMKKLQKTIKENEWQQDNTIVEYDDGLSNN